MYHRLQFVSLLGQVKFQQHQLHQQKRYLQVSVIGACSEIGSNLALLLKQNKRLSKLKLYDDDDNVHGITTDLNFLPGGPYVKGYSGVNKLANAVLRSNLIVMVARTPRTPGVTRDQMLSVNAPSVQNLCLAMTEKNPEAFLAISTNPINSIVPFAGSVLYKNHCFNPFKVFGITNIDTARCKAFVAGVLNINPRHVDLPVIGGHSEETIVPLLSNIQPVGLKLEPDKKDMIIRLVKSAGADVISNKVGNGSANIAMAWAVHEFVDGLLHAICGSQVQLSCYSANPHFGTRYFSGPNVIGPFGLCKSCEEFTATEAEHVLLSDAIRALNKDIALGEDYSRIFV